MKLTINIPKRYLNQPLRNISLIMDENSNISEIVTHNMDNFEKFDNLSFKVNEEVSDGNGL